MANDLVTDFKQKAKEKGWDIILSVHDEIVCEVPNEPEYTVAKLEEMMCALPSWAAGFPLAAEGAELMRYAK